jgi:hypothetical protein
LKGEDVVRHRLRPIRDRLAQIGWAEPLGIVVLGALLRIYRLGTWDFVLDEGFQLGMTARPPGEIVATVVREDPFHPPLFHLVLYLWRNLGEGEVTLRMLSVILGTLSIWLVYRIGTQLVDRRVGLLAAFILAISPFHVYYSQEFRMYPMVFFLSLLALDALVRVIREGRPAQWLGYGTATALALYTDYGAFLALAAHNVAVAFLAVLRRGPHLGKWVLTQAVILVLYMPWIPVMVRAFRPLADPARVSPVVAAAPDEPIAHSVVTVAHNVAFTLAAFTSAHLPMGQPVLKTILVVIFGGVVLAGAWALRHRVEPLIVLGSLTLVPVVLGAYMYYILGLVFPRTLMAATAGYYTLMAAGFLALPRRHAGPLLLAGLVAVNLYSLNILYHRTLRAPPWSQVASYVHAEIRPGEGMVFVDGRWRWLFGLYYPEPMDEPADGYEGPRDLERVQAFVDAHQGLYVVLKEERKHDPEGRIRQYVQSRMKQTTWKEFPGGVRVERYQR